MIAKIYPLGHPDLLEKKDPSHPVRYFDIRKLTPRECYRLMGVSDERIDTLLSKGERNGRDELIIANTSHYKLAGNSIVCDVLKYIYESLIYPRSQHIEGEEMSLFAQRRFSLPLRRGGGISHGDALLGI